MAHHHPLLGSFLHLTFISPLCCFIIPVFRKGTTPFFLKIKNAKKASTFSKPYLSTDLPSLSFCDQNLILPKPHAVASTTKRKRYLPIVLFFLSERRVPMSAGRVCTKLDLKTWASSPCPHVLFLTAVKARASARGQQSFLAAL